MAIAQVAAIIVTWNKLQDVCLLLQDLAQLDLHTIHLDIHLDIYVVDNASTDGTQVHLEESYPHVKVLQTGKNLGGSGGFSYGLNAVRGLDYDYLWLLDNDIRVDSEALVFLVKTLLHQPEIGIVGSQIRKRDDPGTIQEIGGFVHKQKAHLTTHFGNAPVASVEPILREQQHLLVDICAAASLLVRRQVVEQIGVFEDYFLHFDDVEWCLRAKQASWLIAANPASIVWHASPDFKYRPWISYYDERNLCYCWQKHQPQLVLKRIWVLLPKLLYYAATGRYCINQIYFQGFFDFLKGVRGQRTQPFPYTEYSLDQILYQPDLVLFVQDTVCQNSELGQQIQQLQADEKIRIWNLTQTIGSYLWTLLSALFRKPVDMAVVAWHKPNFRVIPMAKQIYLFIGSGYTLADFRISALLGAIANTFYNFCIIYWQLRRTMKPYLRR